MGGGEGGKAAAKIYSVNNSTGCVPCFGAEDIWRWGSGCASLSVRCALTPDVIRGDIVFFSGQGRKKAGKEL